MSAQHHGHKQRGRPRARGGAHHHYSRPVVASELPACVAAATSAAAAEEEEDEEDLEFKREAAHLFKQVAPKQVLPAGLSASTLAAAVKQLVAEMGLSKADAEEALLATAEEHCKQFAIWLDEAQMWLAVRAESNTEADKLKQAMEVSLAELAAARAAAEAEAPPLCNLSEERLRRKFNGSALLRRLEGAVPGALLFSDASPLRELVKFRLVELLRLEQKCCRALC
ncbi:hypothetical protein COO60DRAFT_615276 [Scenedesmus sp. NREL 46B-D3]|nr:hypothetical protein COO60DRAFT_615276 [Scenedesmus sp. NREL 46B-D3]